MTVSNKIHISLAYGVSLGRVYYDNGELHCISFDNADMSRFSCSTIREMTKYIIKLFESTCATPDLHINYPDTTTRKHVKKIKAIMRLQPENEYFFISRCVGTLLYK